MVRLNLLLLAVLVVCALSLVTSRHQARKLFVELEREQAKAHGYETEFGQLQLEQSTWSMPVRVEKIAREQLRMQLPGPGRVEVVTVGARAMTSASATLKRAPPVPALPRFRAPLVFGLLLLLFMALVARSLYLQWIDNAFLQEQGSSRYSREIEVPAHRGRIVDRSGEPLAISTPVKSIWAFPGQVEMAPDKRALLALALETTPQALARKLDDGGDFVFLAKQVPPEVAARVAALKIKGIHDQTEYRRFYPGGDTMSHILGFTGDRDVGQEGLELTQQEWLGGKPGSRRVIINRRGEIVEDVESIRAPQAGRDLALAIDSRLQYLAFRELKAAVEANRAKAGGLVVLDAQSGEILALANWPTYNPNARNRVARERMRNRALTDVFEPGSTMKPFTIASALESGKVRPDTVIQTAPGTLTIGPNTIHDAHRERRADGRAGDSEVVERRRRQDRAVAAAGDDVANARRRGVRHAAQHRFPRRSLREDCGRRRPGSRSSRRRWRTATESRSTWCSSRALIRCSRARAN